MPSFNLDDLRSRLQHTLEEKGIHDGSVVGSIWNVLNDFGIHEGGHPYFLKLNRIDSPGGRTAFLKDFFDALRVTKSFEAAYESLGATWGRSPRTMSRYLTTLKRHFLNLYRAARDSMTGQDALDHVAAAMEITPGLALGLYLLTAAASGDLTASPVCEK